MAATADLLIRARADMASALAGLQRMEGAVNNLATTTQRSSTSFGSWARNAASTAAGMIASQVATQLFSAAVSGVRNTISGAITDASDLNETVNKVQVVFGTASSTVESFASNSASALGMSRNQALSAAGTFGNLFRTIGLGQDTSAAFSTNLLQNAADLASFNNIDPGIVLEKLQAGLVGEAEPLRRLGIDVMDATMQLEAQRQGITKSTADMTQAEKVALRYALIQRQIGAASGDFARTATAQANATRIVDASLANASATLGGRFQPAIAAAMSALAVALPGAIVAAGPLFDVFGRVATGAIEAVIPVIQQLPFYLSLAGSAAQGLEGAASSFGAFVSAAAPIVGVVVAFIALNAVVGATPALLTGIVGGLTSLPGIFAGIVTAINPVTLSMLAMLAVSLVVYTAWTNNWFGIKDAVTSNVDEIIQTIRNMFPVLSVLLSSMQLLGKFPDAAKAFKLVFAEISGAVTESGVGEAVAGAAKTVNSAAGTAVTDLRGTLGQLGGVITEGLGGLLPSMSGLTTKTMDAMQGAAKSVTGVGAAAAATADPLQAMKDNLDAAKEAVSGTRDALSAAKEELQRFAGAAMPGEWAIQDQMTALDVQIAGIKQSQAQKALDRMNRRPARTPGQQLARLELQKTILGYQMTPIEAQHKALQRLASDQVTMSFAVAAAGVTASKNQVTALEGELKARQNVVKEMEKAIKLAEASAKAAKLAPGGATGAGVTAMAGVGLPFYLQPGTAIVPGLGNTVPMTSLGRAPLPWEYYGGTTAGALGGPTMPSNVSLSVQVAVTGVGTELSQEIAIQTEQAVRTAFQDLVTGAGRTQGAASKSLPGAI